ncbi:MAG: glycosyltransferase family 2 protein [Cyanobium sp.]
MATLQAVTALIAILRYGGSHGLEPVHATLLSWSLGMGTMRGCWPVPCSRRLTTAQRDAQLDGQVAVAMARFSIPPKLIPAAKLKHPSVAMLHIQPQDDASINGDARVALLVPCFNEEASAPDLFQELNKTIKNYHHGSGRGVDFQLLIIDDGSTDETVKTFERLFQTPSEFKGGKIIQLSRNFGKEAAILAGLRHCDADACIILDADLQDPPSLIPLMIQEWQKGFQVVNAVRSDRSSDTVLKRMSSHAFYSIFFALSRLEVQFNASDYRLLDRMAIQAILSCDERVRFSKGFFAWIGFEQGNVTFIRPSRKAGLTKWNEWKLWNYALDGIFSFSTAPLRIWTYLGLMMTVAAFVVGLKAAIRTIFYGIDVPGYASLFFAVTFLGGLQLIGIGILGEYIGRTYIETKRRPLYVIKAVKQIP